MVGVGRRNDGTYHLDGLLCTQVPYDPDGINTQTRALSTSTSLEDSDTEEYFGV